MKKLLRFFAVLGALWTITPKAAGAEAKENVKAKADVTVFANTEQVDDGSTFGDLTLKPCVEVEKDDYKFGYLGSFYNWGYTDRTRGDWMTLMSRLQLETSDWALQVGRMQLRPDYVAYLKTPMTTTLDNDIMCAGTCRTFTGTHLAHKGTGLGVGLVANDTRMTPTHWDTGLVTWEKKFGNEWGVAAHVGAGDKGLHNAGATVAYMPTDKTSVVAEGIYDKETTHGILGVRHKLTDDLAMFAGLKVDKPNHGKVGGWATAGLSYDLGKGFSLVGAIKQDIGGCHETHGIVGLRYFGNFGVNNQ